MITLKNIFFKFVLSVICVQNFKTFFVEGQAVAVAFSSANGATATASSSSTAGFGSGFGPVVNNFYLPLGGGLLQPHFPQPLFPRPILTGNGLLFNKNNIIGNQHRPVNGNNQALRPQGQNNVNNLHVNQNRPNIHGNNQALRPQGQNNVNNLHGNQNRPNIHCNNQVLRPQGQNNANNGKNNQNQHHVNNNVGVRPNNNGHNNNVNNNRPVVNNNHPVQRPNQGPNNPQNNLNHRPNNNNNQSQHSNNEQKRTTTTTAKPKPTTTTAKPKPTTTTPKPKPTTTTAQPKPTTTTAQPKATTTTAQPKPTTTTTVKPQTTLQPKPEQPLNQVEIKPTAQPPNNGKPQDNNQNSNIGLPSETPSTQPLPQPYNPIVTNPSEPNNPQLPIWNIQSPNPDFQGNNFQGYPTYPNNNTPYPQPMTLPSWLDNQDNNGLISETVKDPLFKPVPPTNQGNLFSETVTNPLFNHQFPPYQQMQLPPSTFSPQPSVTTKKPGHIQPGTIVNPDSPFYTAKDGSEDISSLIDVRSL